jgi:hypothetical protein
VTGPEFALIVELTVGFVFLGAALSKARSFGPFTDGLLEYDLIAPALVRPVGAALIALELALAVAHLTGALLLWAAAFGLVFLAGLEAVVLVTVARGRQVPCLCFGVTDREAMGVGTGIRIASLIAAEALLLKQSIATGAPSLDGVPSTDAIAAGVCAGLALIAISWLFELARLREIARDCQSCSHARSVK